VAKVATILAYIDATGKQMGNYQSLGKEEKNREQVKVCQSPLMKVITEGIRESRRNHVLLTSSLMPERTAMGVTPALPPDSGKE